MIPPQSVPQPGGMRASRIFETCIYASDLDAAQAFYTTVFGLELIVRFGDRGLALRCGGGALLIFNPVRTRVADSRLPVHGTESAGHLAFLAAPETLPAWREHLARHGVAIETEIDWPEGGRSLYMRDPAGNSVELAPPTLWGGLGVG
jgi:catechol 2,3-dioxygenase-like lactoylglutathione lyase family enzyme